MAEGHRSKRRGKHPATGRAPNANTRQGMEMVWKKVAEGHLSKRRRKHPVTGEAPNANTQGMAMLLKKSGRRPPFKKAREAPGKRRSTKCKRKAGHGDVIERRWPKATSQKDEGSTQQQEKHRMQNQGQGMEMLLNKGGRRPPLKKPR